MTTSRWRKNKTDSKSKNRVMEAQRFNLVIDGVPYEVKAVPYKYNNETRFRVNYNGSEDYIFTRDSGIGRLTAIGDEAIDIPDNLEEAIAERLSFVASQPLNP